ncbi:hypothetical protein J6590_070434 [Homalodisca vitripennis]|nr:hypothetical protein J6590_070434 [Homalodisca vitripennis]
MRHKYFQSFDARFRLICVIYCLKIGAHALHNWSRGPKTERCADQSNRATNLLKEAIVALAPPPPPTYGEYIGKKKRPLNVRIKEHQENKKRTSGKVRQLWVPILRKELTRKPNKIIPIKGIATNKIRTYTMTLRSKTKTSGGSYRVCFAGDSYRRDVVQSRIVERCRCVLQEGAKAKKKRAAIKHQNSSCRCVPERVSNAWTGRFLVGESPTHQGEHLSLTVHNAFSYCKKKKRPKHRAGSALPLPLPPNHCLPDPLFQMTRFAKKRDKIDFCVSNPLLSVPV